MADFPLNLRKLWNLTPPFYLRMVGAAWHWGASEDDFAERVSTILEKVFASEDGRISVYVVRNPAELRRVVVALDSNRQRPAKNPIRFIGISEYELRSFQLECTTGLTKCRGANTLHRDILVKDKVNLKPLVETILKREREVRNFPKKEILAGRERSGQEFCNALVESWGCACDRTFRRLIYWFKKLRRKDRP